MRIFCNASLSFNIFSSSSVPSEPYRVTAKAVNFDEVVVSWERPLFPRGTILGYRVFMSPPLPPILMNTKEMKTSFKYDFEANSNYSFWVTFTFLPYLILS